MEGPVRLVDDGAEEFLAIVGGGQAAGDSEHRIKSGRNIDLVGSLGQDTFGEA
jgi:hypothetical protein